MQKQFKTRSLIATVVALSLVGSGSALADRSRDRHSGEYGHGGYQNKHYSYNRHYSYKKHYRNRYNRHNYRGGYNNYYGGSYYRNGDDHGTEKLLGGLLVGGLVGYALGNSNQQDHRGYDSYPQSGTQRQAQPAIHTEYQRSSAATCLQEREYQTTVIIGGREVDAYGTACLQPDGSWSRGSAKPVPF